MKNELYAYRKSYEKHQLLETEIPDNPFQLFKNWFREIEASKGVEEVNAMTVSTIGLDGFPKSRVVLLKEFDEEGFVFYTNYRSEKGKALLNNPRVCLSFFWPKAERQIIIKGKAQKTSEENSTHYFHRRPRGSQLGAWASEQSRVVASREELELRQAEFERKFEGQEIPKPDFWGGFKVFPQEFEFWQGRPNRLHDRIYFSRENEKDWKINRLAP